MQLSDLIKRRMDTLQISQGELAKRMDVSPSTVNRYISGKIKSVGSDKLYDLANALHIPMQIFSFSSDIPDNPLSSRIFQTFREYYSLISDPYELSSKVDDIFRKQSDNNQATVLYHYVGDFTLENISTIESNWYLEIPDYVNYYTFVLGIDFGEFFRIDIDLAYLDRRRSKFFDVDFSESIYDDPDVAAEKICSELLNDMVSNSEHDFLFENLDAIFETIPLSSQREYSKKVLHFAEELALNTEFIFDENDKEHLTSSQKDFLNLFINFLIDQNKNAVKEMNSLQRYLLECSEDPLLPETTLWELFLNLDTNYKPK